jgi:AAA domain
MFMAGTGEGAEAQGLTVEGFAPTSRAAHKLAEAGIETSTLQHHLARGERPDTGE